MKILLNAVVIFLTVYWSHDNIIGGTDIVNVSDSVLGCSYNNTKFANGSFVPTPEPCLNCKCLNSNLICALRVCPEQLVPPPRGCVIVQKRDSCCSYLTCSKLHNTKYKDDNKQIVTHDRKWYEQNIRNRIFSQNALQRRIEDPDEDQRVTGNGKMCIHNGTVYRSGSAMTTSSLCSYCYCIEGKQKCIKPKCILPAKGCEPILIDSTCCPIRYDCSGNGTVKARYNTKYNRRRNDNKHYMRMTSRMQRSRGCLVDSTFYPEGHKLPKNQTNPCEICFCIGGSKRCTPKKCAPMIKNCKPIIPNGQCCPSSYDCEYKQQKLPTAREFTPRQYDFFSLFFDEEENSTKHWDDDSDIEASSAQHNSTNEKSFLDAIKEGLKYIDNNAKQQEKFDKTEKLKNESKLNPPSLLPPRPLLLNSSANNDESYDVEDEEEEDEEVSILDYFLNAKVPSSTEPQNIPLDMKNNAITNSPMHIQPILPNDMKNESFKFAMLPMSLYNMVKDDGTIEFNRAVVTTETPKTTLTNKVATKKSPVDSIGVSDTKKSNQTISYNGVSTAKTTTPPKIVVMPETATPKISVKYSVTDTQKIVPNNLSKINSTVHLKVETSTAFDIESKEIPHRNNVSVAASANKTVVGPITTTTTKKGIELNANTFEQSTNKIPSASTIDTKPTIVVAQKNVSINSSTASAPVTPNKSTKITTHLPKIPSTTTLKPSFPLKTTKTALKFRTPLPMAATTNKPYHIVTNLPTFDSQQIHSNPSILEADINYDYGEATLPPSLPNLKIIPFLPTDAVKHIVKSDGYKPNYNYYQSNQNAYTNVDGHHQQQQHEHSANYSPFNVKPSAPVYHGNIADDRIDYDTYKETPENKENIDYINIYGGTNVAAASPSGQIVVNSKVDYDPHANQNVYGNPSKLPATTTNKNLVVKPPLPPFEPEHEYDLYHLPPPTKLQTDAYNEYHVNGPTSNDAYVGEHNYHVPHLVTARPIKQPPYASVDEKIPIDSVFSYKNQFSPPLQTEGGFVPKRGSSENYIPLRATNYYVDTPASVDANSNTENSTNPVNSGKPLTQQVEIKEMQPNDVNQTYFDFEKHIISITTDANYKSTEDVYSDAFVGFDVINSVERLPEKHRNAINKSDTIAVHMQQQHKQHLNIATSIGNNHSASSNQTLNGNTSFNNLYGFLFKDEEIVSQTPSSSAEASTALTTTATTTTTELSKPHKTKNSTNNSNQVQNQSIPLKLITILNNTKKESPTKPEIPQRKNNKIIDPNDEPLLEDINAPTTTEMDAKNDFKKGENLTILRDVLLATIGRPTINNAETPMFLQRPINKLSPSFISSPSFSSNVIESKHSFQSNPIRSELDLIIPELNKNKQNDFSHMNNYSPENYQVLPADDDTHISNTESYVINPVDVDKLKVHHTHSSDSGLDGGKETQIFTPPHKDPAGLLKLAGCNIYGRMYRVGRIIAELSSNCLECRCTEVGVSCTPLNC